MEPLDVLDGRGKRKRAASQRPYVLPAALQSEQSRAVQQEQAEAELFPREQGLSQE